MFRRILDRMMSVSFRRSRRIRHGYTHETYVEGCSVVKRYKGEDASACYEIESEALEKLRDIVPVPQVLSRDSDTFSIRMQYIVGINGADIDNLELAAGLHKKCGAMLKHFQLSVDKQKFDKIPVNGEYFVHGDYSIGNIMTDLQCAEIAAVLDWEQAHFGSKLEDVCWYEWTLRNQIADTHLAARLLGAFFCGYGEIPIWSDRHEGILQRLDSIIADATKRGDRRSIVFWKDRRDLAASYDDLFRQP